MIFIMKVTACDCTVVDRGAKHIRIGATVSIYGVTTLIAHTTESLKKVIVQITGTIGGVIVHMVEGRYIGKVVLTA